MSKYVCSDLHGDYESFFKMLDTINFNENDELYILGDIFDRGENPIKILDYVVGHENIHLLKGNHEKMFEDYYKSGDASYWYYNGGETTLAGIVPRGEDFQDSLYKYIKSLPIIKVVDKFILVHAGLYLPQNYNELELSELLDLQEEDINTWTREYTHSDKKYRDYTIVCGHNIVQTIEKDVEEPKIIHRKGHIFIDCGCCFKQLNGRLAVLRLDDMKEFYI